MQQLLADGPQGGHNGSGSRLWGLALLAPISEETGLQAGFFAFMGLRSARPACHKSYLSNATELRHIELFIA